MIQTLSTEQLVDNLRHNPSVDIAATDNEGGQWIFSFRAEDPNEIDEDSIEYTDPNGDEDEVEVGTFVSLHAQYAWTIEAIK